MATFVGISQPELSTLYYRVSLRGITVYSCVIQDIFYPFSSLSGTEITSSILVVSSGLLVQSGRVQQTNDNELLSASHETSVTMFQ